MDIHSARFVITDLDGGRVRAVDLLRVDMREEVRDDDEEFVLALLETFSLLDDGDQITLCVFEEVAW